MSLEFEAVRAANAAERLLEIRYENYSGCADALAEFFSD